MIRQTLVQNRAFDLSAMNNPLPPLNTLPQWSRINAFDKTRYPKPFIKDQKVPMNLLGGLTKKSSEDDDVLTVTEMNPSQRIQYLERSILFLKQQHSEMLHSLHDETEMLKKENKDLQFKIVMGQKTAPPKQEEQEKGKHAKEDKEEMSSASSYSKLLDESMKAGGSRKNDEMKILFLEEEIKELRHAVKETRNKNQYLIQLLEQAEDQKRRQQGAIDELKYQMTQGGMVLSGAPGQILSDNQAVQTNGQPSTLQQCHALIKHLQQVIDQQSHETAAQRAEQDNRVEALTAVQSTQAVKLDRLKLDLRDVLYSHKWTPDAFLMAKAYVADDNMKEEEKTRNFPKIPLKISTRKLPELAYIRDSVSLPALRQTMGNKAVERRKRTQILQRARMRPGALLP